MPIMPIIPNDVLECLEDHAAFTKGYFYRIRVTYDGGFVLWDDDHEFAPIEYVDLSKFKVVYTKGEWINED